MRSLSTLLLLACGTAANAQLSLLPQIGLENARTSIQRNNTVFNPLGNEISPRASLRLDYKFKKGHGPFIGVATSPAVVQLSFTDPNAALSQFKAVAGNLHLRFEGGYGYTTRPIPLGKNSRSNLSRARLQKGVKAPAQKSVTKTTAQKRDCGSYTYRSQCGNKNITKTIIQKYTAPKENWNLRLQPTVGAAYIPKLDDMQAKDASYQYNAGNWNTALVSGLGFEFGKGIQRKFTVSVYYLKGLGNLDAKTLTTESDGKASVTRFQSSSSSWSAGLGIPFTLAKKKAVLKTPVQYKQQQQKQEYKKQNCEEVKKRCGGIRA
jgi:hypothetical protein